MKEETSFSFGYWLRRQRKALDLTQQGLADLAGYAVATIKKIESDQRRPSLQMAARLADIFGLPERQRQVFIECARGLRPVDHLRLASEPESLPIQAAALPADATPFIGRQAELRRVFDILNDADCRMLTLLGPGGAGKTRLALRAAAGLAGSYAAGACFVPLDAAASAERALDVLRQQLGLPHSAADDSRAAVLAYLRPRAMLLLMDNFEHLLAGTPEDSDQLLDFIGQLLAECPAVKLLVTSRERVGLREEWLLPLGGLPQTDEAPALFAESARRLQPGFSTEGQQEAIGKICSLVEGLPLAIELAAGWIHLLSARQIAERIREDLDFLATRLRNVPKRHQTLRQLFDHSWQLLTDGERQMLMHASVFRGGFTAEAATAVCGADPALAEPALLLALADAMRREHGFQLDPRLLAMAEALRLAVQTACGSKVFDAAWERGQQMGLADAMRLD